MKLFRRLLLALTILFVIRVSLGSYDPLLTDFAHSKLAAANIPCDFKELKIRLPLSLKLENVSCQILIPKQPQKFIPVEFKSISLSPAWMELVKLSPGIKLSAVPYSDENGESGELTLILSRSINSGESRTDLQVDRFSIKSLVNSKLLSTVNLKGLLDGRFLFSFSSREDLIGSGKLSISGGAVTGMKGDKSPLLIIPTIFALPPMTEINASFPFQIAKNELIFSAFEISSDLGTFRGSGGIKNLMNQPAYNFDGKILLSEIGLKRVGGFLAIAAGVDISKPSEEWQVVVRTETGRAPTFKIKPIQ